MSSGSLATLIGKRSPEPLLVRSMDVTLLVDLFTTYGAMSLIRAQREQTAQESLYMKPSAVHEVASNGRPV